MSHEMSHQYSPYRSEYHNSSQEDYNEELAILALSLDALVATPSNVGSPIRSTTSVDRSGLLIMRSFRYIMSDRVKSGGWAWPLVEKSIDIRLEQLPDHRGPSYHVGVGDIIHRAGVSKTPILNVYEISYDDAECTRGQATIEQPNLSGDSIGSFATRVTTPYDHHALLKELDALHGVLQADDQDNQRSAQLATNI